VVSACATDRQQIKDIMTCNAEVIGPEATIAEAARQMEALDVGVLPVSGGKTSRGVDRRC
jgi:CBS domain-containing protein